MDEFIDPTFITFIDEQLEVNKQLLEMGKSIPEAGTVEPAKVRRFRLYNKDGSYKPKLVSDAFDSTIDIDGRSIPIRIFPVDKPKGLYIHYHGGGFTLGSIHEQDAYLDFCAKQTQMKVISVEYPLAPEHELPEILSVAADALAALIEKNPETKICIGGESAGGNVGLNSLLRLKSRAELLSQVVGINLSYGVFDLSLTPSQRAWGSEFLNLSTDHLKWFYEMALPRLSRDERSAPEYSPLYADLSGLPPALLSVGTKDPLLDDTLFMHRRWQAAGNDAVLKVYPEAPHGFNGVNTQMAKACNNYICGFLMQCLENNI